MKTFETYLEEGRNTAPFPLSHIEAYLRDLAALEKKWDNIVDFTNVNIDMELARNKRALVGLIQGDLQYANEAFVEHHVRTKSLADSIRKYIAKP